MSTQPTPRRRGEAPRSEPVLRYAGATMAFRLESLLGSDPGFAPEDLVGSFVELNGILGLFRGRVRSVEPYVDDALGAGHWVVLDSRDSSDPRGD
jgi:hypothetical protein